MTSERARGIVKRRAVGVRRNLACAIAIAVAVALPFARVNAEVRVVDDSGRAIVLERPARRIVSLAPHVTELLFAAGAGHLIIGTVDYSDYPQAAARIPRVGGSRQLDLELIARLRPDLIVAWRNGSSDTQLDVLVKLGMPLFYNEPRTLADIAKSIEQLGLLAGSEAVAHQAAQAFIARESTLRAQYAGRPPVRVFYQIAERPLMTVNGRHVISDVLRLCGGHNVFGELVPLAPVVSTEAVLAANPEAIGAASIDGQPSTGLDMWKKWPRLTAAARANLFYVPADFISRHTPRMLEGARRMCESLDAARARRPGGAR